MKNVFEAHKPPNEYQWIGSASAVATDNAPRSMGCMGCDADAKFYSNAYACAHACYAFACAQACVPMPLPMHVPKPMRYFCIESPTAKKKSIIPPLCAKRDIVFI